MVTEMKGQLGNRPPYEIIPSEHGTTLDIAHEKAVEDIRFYAKLVKPIRVRTWEVNGRRKTTWVCSYSKKDDLHTEDTPTRRHP